MTVAELEELLAMLPADMGVMVSTGSGCRHIVRVDKAPARRRSEAWVEAGMEAGFGPGLALVDDRHPPHLVLRGDGGPMWWQAFACDVDYTVSGRWPERAVRR